MGAGGGVSGRRKRDAHLTGEALSIHSARQPLLTLVYQMKMQTEDVQSNEE